MTLLASRLHLNIKDQDNDPNTFYNLIFQLSPENEPYQPYLMKYTMDDAFAQSYYSGQADFSSFKGSVSKVRVQGFDTGQGSSFNDDGDEMLMGEDCSGDTQINNNNGTSGGPSDEDPLGRMDPDEQWRCEVYIQPTDWYRCGSYNDEYFYCNYEGTLYEITYENCGTYDMSSSDDDGFCQPTDDNIPIIEPDLIQDIQIISSVKNLINDPCLKSQVDKTIDDALNSTLVNNLKSALDLIGEDGFELKIVEESSFSGSDRDAEGSRRTLMSMR